MPGDWVRLPWEIRTSMYPYRPPKLPPRCQMVMPERLPGTCLVTCPDLPEAEHLRIPDVEEVAREFRARQPTPPDAVRMDGRTLEEQVSYWRLRADPEVKRAVELARQRLEQLTEKTPPHALPPEPERPVPPTAPPPSAPEARGPAAPAPPSPGGRPWWWVALALLLSQKQES